MRVLQINVAYDDRITDPDALLERYWTLTGWGEAISAAGADSVVTIQRFSRDARFFHRGVEYVFCADGLMPRLWPANASWKVTGAAVALRPDLVHMNGLVFPAQTWTLRRKLPPPTAIVVQNHSDGGPIGRAPLLRVAGRVARSAADAFLFAADRHADDWRRAGLIAPHQPAYQVMPASSGFVPAAQRRDTRASVGHHFSGAERSGDGLSVLWVGRLNANKDPLTVLDAFERAAPQLPPWTLTMIYGDGDLLAAVKARVDAAPALRDRVRLAGAVPHDQMPAFYRDADIFIVGSHHEGSGYALMEACASGLVPVVTDIPTFRILTREGSLGALWTAGDAESCARALTVAAPRDLPSLGREVAEHFQRAFSWSAIGRRAFSIYQDVAERRTATFS